MNHGSNVLGSVQDLAAIGAAVRKAGAIFVVDTAQSAGVIPIDMDALEIDVLCFTGHKGLFGPMGIGGMIVADGVEIRHVRVGGTGVDSISEFQPEAYPHRLEAGTGSIPGIAGLNAAQKWFADLGRARPGVASDADHATACGHALSHIEAVEVSHVRHIGSVLDAMGGVTVYGPRGNRPRVATLSFNIDGLPATQVGEMLDADYHVCVRAGLHCAPLVHEDQARRRFWERCASLPATSPTTRTWSTRSGRSRRSRGSRASGGDRSRHGTAAHDPTGRPGAPTRVMNVMNRDESDHRQRPRGELRTLRSGRSRPGRHERALGELQPRDQARHLRHPHGARGGDHPHTHECMEEFLIMEGELIESDGTVLKEGDLASYRPGTRHNSRTETGCLLVGFDWDPPEPAR